MSGISTNLAKEVGYHLVSAQHKVVPLIRREDGGFITPKKTSYTIVIGVINPPPLLSIVRNLYIITYVII